LQNAWYQAFLWKPTWPCNYCILHACKSSFMWSSMPTGAVVGPPWTMATATSECMND
jgi:hypothetical protein